MVQSTKSGYKEHDRIFFRNLSYQIVHHKKWLQHKMDSRNGKGVMKLVRLLILRPLMFKCKMLYPFEDLKK